jgi:hypothetical protein
MGRKAREAVQAAVFKPSSDLEAARAVTYMTTLWVSLKRWGVKE